MTYHNKSKKNKSVKKIRGGSCGCSGGNNTNTQSTSPSTPFSFFKGGASCGAEQPSFSGVPIKSFYGGKDESANPLYTQVASRLVGGKKSKKLASKKNKSKKSKKGLNKQKGGIRYMTSEPDFKLLPTHTMV